MNQVQKKISQLDVYMRQNEIADPFGANVCASLSYKKAERIVVACSIIVSRLKDTEIIKTEVQALAAAIIKDTLALRDGFRATGSNKVSDIVAHVRLLMTSLDVLHASGYLSDKNMEVTKTACAKFVSFLRSSEDSALAESIALTSHFFESDSIQPVLAGQRLQPVHPVVLSGVEEESMHTVSENRPVRALPIKKYIPKGNGSRREALLAVIVSRGKATIKDLVAVVPGISEKTVQRELIAMIQDGVLSKEGERRWTTYSKLPPQSSL